MKVHNHPDTHLKPSKWKDYILQFVMIFLAVSMGFLAENFRQYLTERSKEKQYIESMVRNVKEDISSLHNVIKSDSIQAKGLDSLLRLSHSNMANDSVRRLFYYHVTHWCYSASVFKGSDATFQQLKSTGDYRLIEKDHVADSLAKYDSQISSIYGQGDYYETYFKDILNRIDELVDETVLGDTSFIKSTRTLHKPFPPLRIEDGKLPTFFNKIFIMKMITDSYVKNNLEPQLERSKRLLALLKDKYHIVD
ncbi:MAG TPA: hypothetical protein VHO90_09160 [Bacteroidales bacterium]|nr:hypothetical protein [Bacteroidales bacterium]